MWLAVISVVFLHPVSTGGYGGAPSHIQTNAYLKAKNLDTESYGKHNNQ